MLLLSDTEIKYFKANACFDEISNIYQLNTNRFMYVATDVPHNNYTLPEFKSY